MGQTIAFVPKCNTNHETEEKCNAGSALPNETSCVYDYNILHINQISRISWDLSSAFTYRNHIRIGFHPRQRPAPPQQYCARVVLAFRSYPNKGVCQNMKHENQTPGETISLPVCPPHLIRHVDKRLMSYNIEMTEVTGGTFWKSYSKEQIAGTAEFPSVTSFTDITAMPELMEYYPPSIYTISGCGSLPKSWDPPGFAYPAHGPPKPITTLRG